MVNRGFAFNFRRRKGRYSMSESVIVRSGSKQDPPMKSLDNAELYDYTNVTPKRGNANYGYESDLYAYGDPTFPVPGPTQTTQQVNNPLYVGTVEHDNERSMAGRHPVYDNASSGPGVAVDKPHPDTPPQLGPRGPAQGGSSGDAPKN